MATKTLSKGITQSLLVTLSDVPGRQHPGEPVCRDIELPGIPKVQFMAPMSAPRQVQGKPAVMRMPAAVMQMPV
jgi:hypothetical protein